MIRDGEWYLEKCGSRKILAESRNLGSVFDKSRNLIFAWFVFTFFESAHIAQHPPFKILSLCDSISEALLGFDLLQS